MLAWDDVAYDLRGTCGVVRVSADHATVTMPAATRLVLEGTGNAVTAKPLLDVEVTGAGNSLATPSVRSLVVSGAGTTVTVAGLVELAELSSTSSTLTADVVNVARLRGADAVTARKAYRTRITGSDNVVGLRRADKLRDRNAVTVTRGRTTLRDRGDANVLDLRPAPPLSRARAASLPGRRPPRGCGTSPPDPEGGGTSQCATPDHVICRHPHPQWPLSLWATHRPGDATPTPDTPGMHVESPSDSPARADVRRVRPARRRGRSPGRRTRCARPAR